MPVLLGLLFGLTGLGSAAVAVTLPVLGADDAAWTISLYALMLATAAPTYAVLLGARIVQGTGVRGLRRPRRNRRRCRHS